MTPIKRLPTLLLILTLSACGGSSGGSTPGATSATSTVAPPATATPHTTNQAHWQTAMAALAQNNGVDPLTIEPAALAAWNQLIERNWSGLTPTAKAAIQAPLQQLIGTGQGGISVLAVRNVNLDIDDSPALDVSGQAPFSSLILDTPRSPNRWHISMDVEIGGNVQVRLFGVNVTVPLRTTISVAVRDIHITQPMSMDLRDPNDPKVLFAGTPDIQFQIDIASNDPVVSQITQLLTQILNPVIRVALQGGNIYAQLEVNKLLQQFPQGPAFGVQGASAAAPVANARSLEDFAEGISDDLTNDHMPFGQVYTAVFDSPNGQTVDHYTHPGDSAIWTGSYLTAEAYRHDLTGDPRALAGANKAVQGIKLLLEVGRNGDGLLARAAIPTSSPFISAMGGAHGYHVSNAFGQQYGSLHNISRDQYIGVMMGLGQTYHRVPALRSDVAPLIDRILTYLDRHDWVAYQPDDVTMTVTFGTNPSVVLSFLRVGALTNPGKWGAVYQRHAPMASIFWLPTWVSAQEVHESYYKFNLGHSTLLNLLELETDPAQYRDYLKGLRMLRQAIGHHGNAWFNSVYAMALPPSRMTMGPQIKNELDRFALRPRRGQTIRNSLDPSIAKTTITITTPNAGGAPGGAVSTGPRSKEVASTPLPVERRAPADFLWQRSPFSLDGSYAPERQKPGVDLVLPYWFARNHGVIQ
ncbi:MAG: hypothetical protein P1V97_21580 [Planctomycetota bacterium]|nr:hypothetical protein [Planctomycetota bacterium]